MSTPDPHNSSITRSTKLFYGIGQLSDGVKQASFSTFLFFYYNQVLGLSGSLAGLAALLALVADAVTDPMVGQWSDRFNSRWGRRHPFMLAGAIPSLRRPDGKGPQGNVLLAFVEVFRTLKQNSFRILFTTVLIFNTLAGVIATLLVYVATYVFEFKPEQMAGLASSVLIGIIFASHVAQSLARRFDKKNALALCVIVGGVFAFSPQVLYFTGILEQMATGSKFAYVFTVNGISQVFFIAYIILLDSMLSDVIDERELHSGQREEGLFFAARSFATKASYGLGSFFAGIGLDIIRFPRAATPENVPPEAVLSLAILSGPMLFVLFAVTVVISSRFPLTEVKHREIMREIKLRAAAER